MSETTPDTRIAYGAQCSWWGDIKDVGTKAIDMSKNEARIGGRLVRELMMDLPETERSLPCCPVCKGMLYELDSEADYLAAAEKYATDQHDQTYVEFVKWAKGKCFRTVAEARMAFAGRKK